jgi:hypothetical protein
MASITLTQLWTVTAVLVGFQVASLSWRINREVYMEAKGERTWVTWADGFVGASFLVLVGGVFAVPVVSAAPVVDAVPTMTVVKLFGLALTLFTPSVFVLAGHYNLYCDWGVKYKRDGSKFPRGRVTNQEWVAVGVGLILPAAYMLWWIFS